tara:strand:- start:1970 stop:2920 length:951 start_codon:yes stop_codon:yes gene_type:complete
MKISLKVKSYSEINSRRQPWYTVKWLKEQFIKHGYEVDIVEEFDNHDTYKIAIFSLRHFFLNEANAYVLTFPFYKISDYNLNNIKILIIYWKNFYKILIASLLLILFKKKYTTIILSQNALNFSTYKYYPLIPLKFNWDLKPNSNIKYDFCYYGPPYESRGFQDLVDFTAFAKNNSFLFILRPDIEFTKREKKLIENLKFNKNVKLVIEFMNEKNLMIQIQQASTFLLPFPLVMSEGPTVIFEALSIGRKVITTKNSGFFNFLKNESQILILDRINKNNYDKILKFQKNKFVKNNFNNSISKINNESLNNFINEEL